MAQGNVKIKICGMRILSDIDAVNAVLPEYCGFIFDPSRRRYVRPEDAEALRLRLDPRIRPVGVFVNAGTKAILEVLSVCHVDMVQLHGQETNADIDDLRAAIRDRTRKRTGQTRRGEDAPQPGPDDTDSRPFQIVKAYRIDTAEDMKTAKASHADLILLDHGIGGTGETFDWTLIRDCGRDFILAGGLGPGNVAGAIALTHPFAVDASSSLETDGHKDPEKVQQFVRAVRECS